MAGRRICIAVFGMSFLTTYVGGSLRLIGGDNQYEGRLEIYNNGEWMSICRDFWNSDNTIVSCRQMGLKGGSWRRVESHEIGDKTFLTKEFDCNGDEERLEKCSSEGKSTHGCTHGRRDDVYLTCRPQKDGVLRLQGGPIQYEGRLEIYHDNEWGTICSDEWEDHPQNAEVACRQLGYIGGSYRQVKYAERASWSVEFLMDDVKCQGNETSIQDCPFRGWGVNNCYSYSKEIYLECEYRKDNLTRVVGGSNQYEGRLEVYYDSQWGSVCIHPWNSFVLNAHVACRQLGNTGGSFRRVTAVERGEGPFWMDSIECDGDESNLRDCNFKGWQNRNCSHSANDDVFLMCNPTKGAVQLVDGSNRYNGRVQVFYGGTWTNLCNDEWSSNNLKVTCRQLGTTEKSSGDVAFTEGYHLTKPFQCSGTEEYLYKCPYRDRSCSSSANKVVVTCEIPESSRNGPCDTELQETCGITLTCQDVNGFGRCVCDNESFWDGNTKECKTKISYNEVCDPSIDEVCTSNLSCHMLNGSTSFQHTCLCSDQNDFWDSSDRTCRLKKFYAEVCDPTFENVCFEDLSCEYINGTSLNKCICPDENDFWDSLFKTCRRRTSLQGIYVSEKLNITEALSHCETEYEGHLATEEHLRHIFSNCSDYNDDTWLIRIIYASTGKQLGSCAMLYSNGELTTENCTGRRPSVCITKKNKENDQLCVGFPAVSPQKFTSNSAGLIGGVVACLIILAVVVLLGIGFVLRRRKRESNKDSDMVDNQAYEFSNSPNKGALNSDIQATSKPHNQPVDEYDYAMGTSDKDARNSYQSNIYVNDMTAEQNNEGYISVEQSSGYANYTKSHRPPNGAPCKNSGEGSFTYMLTDETNDPSPNTDDLPTEEYNTFTDVSADHPPTDTYDHVHGALPTEEYNTFTDLSIDPAPTDTYDHVHNVPEDGYDELQLRSSERSNFEEDEETGYMQSSFPG